MLGRHTEALHKGAAKAVGIMKANGVGHAFHGCAGGGQPGARFIQPQSLHEGGGSAFELVTEPAGELARTKIHVPSQHVDGKVPIQVSHHPGRQVSEAAGGGDLKLQGLGKLFLSSRALHIHHEFARYGESDLWSEVFFDQRQGKINAGSNARRGVKLSVANVERAGIDLETGKTLRQFRRRTSSEW